MKTLKLSEETALRLYPTAAPEFKEMLEQNFGKEFFSQKISDRIKTYEDICNYLGVSSDDDDLIIEIDGFSKEDILVMKALAKKMRITKVYNQGWIPKGNELRYYSYYYRSNPSSEFEFNIASYDYACVYGSSASRLCFKTAEDAKDVAMKFKKIDLDFFDVK